MKYFDFIFFAVLKIKIIYQIQHKYKYIFHQFESRLFWANIAPYFNNLFNLLFPLVSLDVENSLLWLTHEASTCLWI